MPITSTISRKCHCCAKGMSSSEQMTNRYSEPPDSHKVKANLFGSREHFRLIIATIIQMRICSLRQSSRIPSNIVFVWAMARNPGIIWIYLFHCGISILVIMLWPTYAQNGKMTWILCTWAQIQNLNGESWTLIRLTGECGMYEDGFIIRAAIICTVKSEYFYRGCDY